MMIKKYPVWVTVEQAKDIETFLTLLREPIQKNLKKCKLPKVKRDCEIAVNKLNYLMTTSKILRNTLIAKHN